MSARFERFSKMVKEEFGLTVTQSHTGEKSTFESLFGVSAECIAQYELPYNLTPEQIGYYSIEAIISNQFETSNEFTSNDIIVLAA